MTTYSANDGFIGCKPPTDFMLSTGLAYCWHLATTPCLCVCHLTVAISVPPVPEDAMTEARECSAPTCQPQDGFVCAAHHAREIVDRDVWPTSDGPFVRVNDKPRDLERLVSSIAAALTASQERERRLREALATTRALLRQHWSDNKEWRAGNEHTYLGRIDILAEHALDAAALNSGSHDS